MRPPVMTIADHPALDFLNTIGAPRGETHEWLADGDDLAKWLVTTGLVDSASAAHLGATFGPDALTAVATKARHLREALRAYVETGDDGIIDQVNAILRSGQGTVQILRGDRPQLRNLREYTAPEDLLLPIAEVIADLLTQTDPQRVRKCDGPTCTMWFHDISKNNKRRWCSMAVCGNRAKAAAHRAKSRQG